MQDGKIKVGVVGCGNISSIYLQSHKIFPILDIVACSDLDPGRARAQAEKHGIPRAVSTEELLADPDIRIVVNLTMPAAHGQIALAALKAGKCVYNEKPLASTCAEARKVLKRAGKLLVGCAPDTFLGAGLQTCRKVIDDGGIGKPLAATAFMTGHGPEGFHPNPNFFYQSGGGPLLDMGPYYLTALVTLLGPVRRVCGSATAGFAQRMIESQPFAGQVIEVNVPTHVTAIIEFVSGEIATLITSWDVWGSQLPRIEIYGVDATLSVPDPNTFGGPVLIQRAGAAWETLPLTHQYAENSRGIGAADMAYALQSGRPHRASGELAYHVLDVMETIIAASKARRWVNVKSTCQRPAPLPVGLTAGQLDE